MLMGNILGVRVLRTTVMAVSSDPDDAGTDERPSVGVDHLTVVPENFRTEEDVERS